MARRSKRRSNKRRASQAPRAPRAALRRVVRATRPGPIVPGVPGTGTRRGLEPLRPRAPMRKGRVEKGSAPRSGAPSLGVKRRSRSTVYKSSLLRRTVDKRREICDTRAVRREMVFATGSSGRNGVRTYRRTHRSKVGCP